MTISFPINFEKMSGSGNDFVVIDNRHSAVALEDQPEFSRKICRRMFSVGGNGLIFIENSNVADFSWRFYNGDGSVADMCGNGARCAARFAFRNGIAESKMGFETTAGTIQAEVLADNHTVRVQMTRPFDFRLGLSMSLNGKEHAVAFVNTGVPHAVIFVEGEGTPRSKNLAVRYDFMNSLSPKALMPALQECSRTEDWMSVPTNVELKMKPWPAEPVPWRQPFLQQCKKEWNLQ